MYLSSNELHKYIIFSTSFGKIQFDKPRKKSDLHILNQQLIHFYAFTRAIIP